MMKSKFWNKFKKSKDQDKSEFFSSLSISFNETYFYDITLSNIYDNQISNEPPQGNVSIKIPYNIWRNEEKFTKSLKKEIKLDNYHNTNFDSIAEVWDSERKFSIENALKQAKQSTSYYQDKRLYNLNRITSFSYKPDKLDFSPVSVEIKLFDEVEISDIRELFNLVNNFEKENDDISSAIVKHISEQSGFENSLLFNISVSLKMPKSYLTLQDNIFIKNITLKWPLATSPRHIDLSIIEPVKNPTLNQEQNLYHKYVKYVIYDPEKEEIKWSNLPLFKDIEESEDELAHLEYKSWVMQLSLKEPGEFYNQSILPGKIIISIPTLLSGTRVSSSRTNIPKNSEIHVNLAIHIDELFTNRYFAPYQNLHFPNLILNDMRLADVMLMLKDMRFQDVKWHVIKDKNTKRILSTANNTPLATEQLKKLIIAERQEGSGILQILIYLEGFTTTTTREKAIEGDEKFITGLPAGNTNIYIRGLLKGDNNRVVQVVSEIHDRLKERFRHVSTLK